MTSLNEHQLRAVLVSSAELHRQLREIEALSAEAGNAFTFSLYTPDVSPIEARVLGDCLAQARQRMDEYCRDETIPVTADRTSLRYALQMALAFANVEIDEFRAERLRSFGAADDEACSEVIRLQDQLHESIDRASKYLRQGLGRDLSRRLVRLSAAPVDKAVLLQIEPIVTRWRLYEFRPLLQALVARWETPVFELAVFGRVNSGKSSLLNYLANTDVLPVGTIPVTSVLTRLVGSTKFGAVVHFTESDRIAVPVTRLSQFVTEEFNPSNRKHVTDVTVYLPADRLSKGFALIDTPAIGSLDRAARADTLAYLPRCDMGVVLVDPCSTLSDDDLAIVRRLCEAGIPTQVLLTKADLVGSTGLEQALAYTREQLGRQLGIEIPVYPISTTRGHRACPERWFDEHIRTLVVDHQDAVNSSLGRKTVHLRESVIAALQTLAARHRGDPVLAATADEITSEQQLLREADLVLAEAREKCHSLIKGEKEFVDSVLAEAAEVIIAATAQGDRHRERLLSQTVERALLQRRHRATEIASDLKGSLIRRLEMMERLAPDAVITPKLLVDMTLPSAPSPDVASVRSKLLYDPAPASPLSRHLAVWAMRWALHERFDATMLELVQAFDRALHAWLTGAVQQIAAFYQPYGESFRRELERLHADKGSKHIDLARLENDLHLLERYGVSDRPEGRRETFAGADPGAQRLQHNTLAEHRQ
jgi:GTP-binding protein EngB required for normal cell division